MTAATSAMPRVLERWKHHEFILAAGNKAWAGAAAGIDQSTGRVEPMHNEADLFYIGTFDEDVDATSGERRVSVDLGMEIEVRRWANGGTNTVDAAEVGSLCHFLDDQTVTMDAGPVAGRVWDVDANLGVAVQRLDFSYVAP